MGPVAGGVFTRVPDYEYDYEDGEEYDYGSDNDEEAADELIEIENAFYEGDGEIGGKKEKKRKGTTVVVEKRERHRETEGKVDGVEDFMQEGVCWYKEKATVGNSR